MGWYHVISWGLGWGVLYILQDIEFVFILLRARAIVPEKGVHKRALQCFVVFPPGGTHHLPRGNPQRANFHPREQGPCSSHFLGFWPRIGATGSAKPLTHYDMVKSQFPAGMCATCPSANDAMDIERIAKNALALP